MEQLRTHSQEQFMEKLFLNSSVKYREVILFYPCWKRAKTTIEAGEFIHNFLNFLNKRKKEIKNGKKENV